MTAETPQNIAQTVAKILETQPDVVILPAEETYRNLANPLLASVPAGRQIMDLTHQLRAAQGFVKPLQRKGRATMNNLTSLIDWALRFKGENSVLFADNNLQKPKLTCISDYHLAGPATALWDGDPTARHCHHTATYCFPLSKQWQEWMKQSGAAISGLEMGAFLENNILDVIDPPLSLTSPGIAGSEATEADMRLIDIARRLDGSYGTGVQLLGMAKSFTVHESSEFVEARNTTTGEATLVHKSEHTDGTGQPIRIPKLFLIAIPVFEDGPAYRLPVRFQYRKNGAQVKFFLTLHDPRHAQDHAFNEAVTHATAETGMPTFTGTPEA
jgi:Uncharacterized conserved protein (DUF2303)